MHEQLGVAIMTFKGSPADPRHLQLLCMHASQAGPLSSKLGSLRVMLRAQDARHRSRPSWLQSAQIQLIRALKGKDRCLHLECNLQLIRSMLLQAQQARL